MKINSKDIKCITLDIDNTILPVGKVEISRRLKEDLDKASKKGIQVMINSGRHASFLPQSFYRDLPMELTGTINGGCLIDRNKKVLSAHLMSDEDRSLITDLCIKYDVALGFKFVDSMVTYHKYDAFIASYLKHIPHNKEAEKLILNDDEKRDYHIEHGNPVGAFLIGEDKNVEMIQEGLKDMEVTASFDDGYDVFLKSVNKAVTVEEALKIWHLEWKNVIAFGDAGNDIPFLEKAGISVAMGNGKEVVKKMADIIAPRCEDDGVAKILEDLKIV